MRRLALVLLLAACQMQAPGGGPAGVSGIADEAIEVTTLEAALPTDAAVASPAVTPPTAGAAPPTEGAGVTPAVAPPTAGTALPTDGTGVTPAVAPPTEEAAPPVEEALPPPISPEQAKCERGGGTWAKVGALGRICVKPTGQGGKSCRVKSDCKGECLAQSGTCAPIAPLMGCNEVMDNQGRRMTQCLE
ncbi:hypothetical protein [Stagnihabitans tardus]|uniref:Uncharacterized protein n=1 Tax=Stagnihabitans tardus TaxID=2699202 RepID=A0AAE5BUB1_9RHOB|nr:hypothetical protein [Stagnihabitans tardus]NBZ87681.1 hypothetical protein [Stagnihabitans tardus]